MEKKLVYVLIIDVKEGACEKGVRKSLGRWTKTAGSAYAAKVSLQEAFKEVKK